MSRNLTWTLIGMADMFALISDNSALAFVLVYFTVFGILFSNKVIRNWIMNTFF